MSRTRTGGPCPKCHGTGQIDEFGIGLVVVCDECAGAYEEHPHADEDHQRNSPVWRHPAVAGLGVCRTCLGSGVVVSLGGTGDPTGHVIESPCPDCSWSIGQG